jgi:multiple antibiotic resistance protein
MSELVNYGATAFAGFFAIMNPLANTPVFLGLTRDDNPAIRRAVARTSLLLAFGIITVFTIGGNVIFDLFGITLYAFRVTGGILVFGIGYRMLHGEGTKVHQSADANRGEEAVVGRDGRLSVAISPLAVPIFAGPGTIATAMNFVADGTFVHILITLGAFASICVISYVFFVSGERLIRYLGENAVDAITKMMGMILAVIGAQMFIEGVHGAIQHYR